MASSQTRPGSIPESFSPQERFLAEKTEEAILDGVQLERWCHDPNRQIREFPLNLKKAFALPNQPAGYFGHVPINGKTESVMGVRQTVDFSRVAGANPGKQLRDFVLGEFLSRAHLDLSRQLSGRIHHRAVALSQNQWRVRPVRGREPQRLHRLAPARNRIHVGAA